MEHNYQRFRLVDTDGNCMNAAKIDDIIGKLNPILLPALNLHHFQGLQDWLLKNIPCPASNPIWSFYEFPIDGAKTSPAIISKQNMTRKEILDFVLSNYKNTLPA